jgi:hypothetical protein
VVRLTCHTSDETMAIYPPSFPPALVSPQAHGCQPPLPSTKPKPNSAECAFPTPSPDTIITRLEVTVTASIQTPELICPPRRLPCPNHQSIMEL